MPRKIQVRETYWNDITKVRRLRDAVAIDNRYGEKWQKETIKALDCVLKQLASIVAE